MEYRIVPVSAEFLLRVRRGRDDQGHPVEFHRATGAEPLRDVLRGAIAGEQIILASYSPFKIAGPYKEYGPVFVRAVHTEAPLALDRLPTSLEQRYFGESFVLRAYDAAERIVDASITSARDADGIIGQFFARTNVAFILARFAAYGCYGCRIERARE